MFFAHLFVTLRLGLEGTFVRKNKKNLNFFGFLLTYSYLCTRFARTGCTSAKEQVLLHSVCTVLAPALRAQMAESVDALVSNTSGATHPGSSPGLGTRFKNRSAVSITLQRFSFFSFRDYFKERGCTPHECILHLFTN